MESNGRKEDNENNIKKSWKKLEFPCGLKREGTELSLQARVFRLNQLQLRNSGKKKKFVDIEVDVASDTQITTNGESQQETHSK